MRVRELIDQLLTVDPDLFVQAKLAPGYFSPVSWAMRANGDQGVIALLNVDPGWEADFVEEHSAIVYVHG